MKEQIDPILKKRRLIVRLALIAVYFGAIALVFVSGKGHTILIDNKDSGEGRFAAIDGVMVTVDRQEELELYSGDRDKADVAGQGHRVKIKSLDGAVDVERTFRLPIGVEMFILSVPRAAAGESIFVEPFMPKDLPAPSDEPVGNTNAFTSPDAIPLPDAAGPPPILPTP